MREISFHEVPLDNNSQVIHDRAMSRAKRYLVAEAELLKSIIEVDVHQIYKQFGKEHLTPYCVDILGLSEEVAGSFVRVARKSHQVPQLQTAVDEGLSLFKAKAIVSVLTPENQSNWIEMAKDLSKAKLEKAVATASPYPMKPEKAKPVGLNRNRIEFELDDANFALQKRAQDLASQKLGRPATQAETQAFLLSAFLDREDPVRKAERAAKRQERPRGHSKSIPAHVLHAVRRRDRGCCQARTPSGEKCLKTRFNHIHHIIRRADGGQDIEENLITLCSGHHRLLHEGD